MRRFLTLALLALVALAGPASAVGTLTTLGAGPGVSSTCADPSWSSVVLLAFNDNAVNGTTTFLDQSASAHSITKTGAATVQYSSSSPPIGMSTSVNYPSTGTFLISADSADWSFGTGDFTIEAYVNISTSGNRAFLSQWLDTGGQHSWILDVSSNTLRFVTNGSVSDNITSASWTPSTGTWYHIAASRVSGTFYIFVDGSQLATNTVSQTLLNASANLDIGVISGGAGNFSPFVGNMASARITKGVGRYTNSFTPPSLPLPHC